MGSCEKASRSRSTQFAVQLESRLMFPPPPKPPIAPPVVAEATEAPDATVTPEAAPSVLPPLPPLTPSATLVLPEGCDEMLHLMGATGLADFLSFARDFADLNVPGTGAVNGSTEMDLAEAWRDAADVYEGVATVEAYPNELPGVFPFPEAMKAHCEAFLATPHVQREFDQVPVAFGMVPLAHLIVALPRLNMTAIRAHGEAIGTGSIADLALAQLCLPLDPSSHSLHLLERGVDAWTFVSDNHDVRLLQARAKAGAAATGRGHVGQTLALELGFPSNVLNVIRYQNRLILNNGYHRAYALLKRGVTHVPAVIQVCRHWDDVGLVGGATLYENRAVFVDRARPPLIRDYADRRLCMHFAAPRLRKYIRIRHQIEIGYLRDSAN